MFALNLGLNLQSLLSFLSFLFHYPPPNFSSSLTSNLPFFYLFNLFYSKVGSDSGLGSDHFQEMGIITEDMIKQFQKMLDDSKCVCVCVCVLDGSKALTLDFIV